MKSFVLPLQMFFIATAINLPLCVSQSLGAWVADKTQLHGSNLNLPFIEIAYINFYSNYPNYMFYVENKHSATWAYKINNAPHVYIYDDSGTITYPRLGGFSDTDQQYNVIGKWIEHIGR